MTTNGEPIDKYAYRLIERIVDQASFDENRPNNKSEDFILKFKESEHTDKQRGEQFVENEDAFQIGNIDWPTIEQFNETFAAKKIDEFIKKTWEYDQCWLYCIDLVDKVDNEFNVLYNFRVRWSIPTRRKPIPRFTASVYFTFDVSKIKPKSSTVDVFYVFETQKLVQRPGLTRFRQQWLNDIIKLKETLVNDCKF